MITPKALEPVERAARAMCIHAGNDPESTIGTGPSGAPLWRSYLGMARAALEAAQPDIEKVAKQ